MILSIDSLIELSKLAEEAAKKAGDLINAYATKTVTPTYKNSGNSPASQVVTEVDHLCEEIILKHLHSSIEKYDLALLTEEQEDDKQRLEKDYFWCIDPLDGTLAFTESKPGYAVSIALVSRTGESHIGVIFDPARHILYTAIKGQGAYRNGERWNLPEQLTSKTITIPFDRSLLARKDFEKIMPALSQSLNAYGYTDLIELHYGGAVMNACWALEQTPSCYFKLPKQQEGGGSLWDFAATTCLYKELAMPSGDANGQALDLNKSNTTFMNEEGVIFASSPELISIIQSLVIQFRT